MSCTACEGKCEDTFVCKTCKRRLNVCREKIGNDRECVACWERRELGPAWMASWAMPHNTTNKDHHAIARIVEASRRYQEQDE